MLLMICSRSGFRLLFASFVCDSSQTAFFILVLIAESIFLLAQFNVFIPILVGDRFTPLESQKHFLVESAGYYRYDAGRRDRWYF